MKTENNLTVSIIIPTHNRCATLRQTLDSLNSQNYPLQQMEVVVIADGCTDETVEMLHHYPASFDLQTIVQPSSGPAAARNQGASIAKGRLLIFLDDDIQADSGLVAAHIAAHQSRPNLVSIGYLPPALQSQSGFFRIILRNWWESMFRTMRQPGHRFTYDDLLSGNFSVEAQLFKTVGGFNTSLWCHEDYEFGMRLLKAGAEFYFTPEAWGYHHEKTDLPRSLQRKYKEGQADIQLGRLHPELRSTLPLTNINVFSSLRGNIFRILVFNQPKVGDFVAYILCQMLDIMELMRLRVLWRKRLDGLLGYWYWRGVADELNNSWSALITYLQGTPIWNEQNYHEVELNLSEGLEVLEQYLDSKRPISARIYYDEQFIGRISPQPGAERLRGVHLRPILAANFDWPILMALVLDRATAKKGNNSQQIFDGFSIQPMESVYVS